MPYSSARGKDVSEIQQAYVLLAPLMGTIVAAKLFGIALFCSGQSSTITGTMAGQIIMEGFLNIRVRPWLRRLVTRLLAIVPAMVAIWLAGSHGTFQLLILSQVVLNLQLPFAIIPLIQFTSDRDQMGEFANGFWLRLGGWASAVIVLGLNIWLAIQTIGGLGKSAGAVWAADLGITLPVCFALLALLAWIAFQPYRQAKLASRSARLTLGLENRSAEFVSVPQYRRILVPIDHSRSGPRRAEPCGGAGCAAYGRRSICCMWRRALPARYMGRMHPRRRWRRASDYLDALVASLGQVDIEVETAIRHGSQARREIVRYAREIQPDLIVMGAHGHGGCDGFDLWEYDQPGAACAEDSDSGCAGRVGRWAQNTPERNGWRSGSLIALVCKHYAVDRGCADATYQQCALCVKVMGRRCKADLLFLLPWQCGGKEQTHSPNRCGSNRLICQ